MKYVCLLMRRNGKFETTCVWLDTKYSRNTLRAIASASEFETRIERIKQIEEYQIKVAQANEPL